MRDIVTSSRGAVFVLALLLCSASESQGQDLESEKKSLEERVQALEELIQSKSTATQSTSELKPIEAGKDLASQVKLNGLLQVWGVNDPTTVFGANEDAETTMRLRRAEIRLSADVIPEMGVVVMVDPAKQIKLKTEASETGELTSATVDQSTNILQDAYVNLRVGKAIPGLREIAPKMELLVGQQKTPITEEGYRSSSKLDLVERSQIGRIFGDFRDQGVLLKDTHNYFDYYLGIFNGSGRNQQDNNNEKNGVARIVLKPFSWWHIATSGEAGSSGKDEKDLERLGFDSQLEAGPASLKAEVMQGKDGAAEEIGFYVQPGIYIIPEKLQLVGRFDQYDPDEDVDSNTIQEIGGSLNWFFARYSARLQLEYLRRNNEATNDEDVILINLQGAY